MIISRSTRKVAGRVVVVRAVADKRSKKSRRRSRGLGSAAARMKLLLLPDYMIAVLGMGEVHPVGFG